MEDPTRKPDLKDKNAFEEPEDKHDDEYEVTTDKEKREKDDEEKEDIDEKKDTEKPLIDDDSVKIDIKSGDEGTDTATLPISDKKSRDDNNAKKEKPPMYLFPITQMKLAWTRSSNILEFLLRATCIVFSTLGWLLCVGGFPFVSVAMLVIGSVYVDDCKAEPNIPVYLIVAGVLGTLQHFMSVWTKYLPKDSQGRMQEYRSYCRAVDSVLHIFLAIWFICGM
ncbi:uncharacterized protein LOC118181151 isoform X1 [Stegodyphus dumicola]|uniref:uncharacterized protein LOC118181151 isoform X1 n=1 Tax=Stegodyphus dumicola TaxID=202533 RepID=UPI0015A8E262|nr:uncharacterized protein LOC118181151 isoform X1 [Stegodyphus dumicola]XP_035206212.1 uncharacterized protein LOC118181151 isoform X1 [Stegodyphus dumicola]